MENAAEEFLTEAYEQEEDAVLREAWPLPFEDTVREFEEYLLDIGVRI